MILKEIKNIYIKNRLTEGVDFKRYEWLKGDGRAYIDTGITDLSVSEYIKFEMDDSNDPAVRCMGCERNTQEGCGRLCFGWQGDSSSGGRTIYMWSDTGTWGANNNRRKWTLDLINNAAYTGSLSKTTGLVFPQKVQSFVLFGSRDSSGNVNIRSQCTMWSFEVHNQINLIPCQLIHAIPATLDANNIARQAGECGMYDSISGKFYGNVDSSGSFTVEGEVEPETHTGLQQIYQNKLIDGVDYQTYDWLKGDGNAYIDTKVTNLSISNYIKTIFDDSGNIGVNIRAWGRDGSGRLVVGNNNSSTYLHVWGADSELVYSNNEIYLYDMYFDLLNNKVTINNQTYNLSLPHGNGANFLLFARNRYDKVLNINLSKFKSFEIHNQINLVPCTLLHSIPRNLDAQCKERQAGECGMIDLISGKFYGNVANSGTFTVENDNNE